MKALSVGQTFSITNPCRSAPLARIRRPAHSRMCRASDRPATTSVVDHLMLLTPEPDVAMEQVEGIVDDIWSLQYLAAGPLAGAAGPVISNQLGPQNTASDDDMPEVVEFAFECRVPNTLEDVFRRTGPWDEGLEYIMLMQAKAGTPAGEAEEFVSLLSQLALAVDPPALQAVHGTANHMKCSGRESILESAYQQGPVLVLMIRFPSPTHLNAFLQLPPCQAVLENDTIVPVQLLQALVYDVAPAQKSQTQRQGRGGLL